MDGGRGRSEGRKEQTEIIYNTYSLEICENVYKLFVLESYGSNTKYTPDPSILLAIIVTLF